MPENIASRIEWPEQPKLPEETSIEAQRRLARLCGLSQDAPAALIREKFNEDLLRDLLYENGFDLVKPTAEQIAFCIREMKKTERMFPNESK